MARVALASNIGPSHLNHLMRCPLSTHCDQPQKPHCPDTGTTALSLAMTLTRYLIRSYLLLVSAFVVIGGAAKPTRTIEDWSGLLVVACLWPLLVLVLMVAPLASTTPPETRETFSSFRHSNLLLIYPMGAITLLIVIVSIGESFGVW